MAKINVKEKTCKALHLEMQDLRYKGEDMDLKDYIPKFYEDPSLTPERFYRELGINVQELTVEKFLGSDTDSRWLFPEIFRDAIKKGLQYAPFYSKLVVGEERIDSSGITMPYFNASSAAMTDVAEGGTITEGTMTWDKKTVTVSKRARGLKQSYESIAWTPVRLAAIYFEDLGIQLGATLDGDLVDVAINGEQGDGSEAATIMGVGTADTLAYKDIVRVWVRMNRINRPSVAILCNESEAVNLLDMAEFKNPVQGQPLKTLNLRSPLPTEQDIYVHSDVPDKQLIFIDITKAFVQLTALPLLVESEKIVSRQLQGQYASITTGFAVVFGDARVLLDYSETLVAEPGPTVALG